ncbi:hypothetical protein DK842_17800 [Chromobacterium phragmitis]|uniref:hypothetical protein n=1 Tax=Chromobacterium phragmitis TaxID=2202141 RepID=UPI000DEC68BC|nr:hypothetical protein [Chromobacterium phragmitis]AXE31590.1 hypothetical protein DK842_17800 [Chromobacterium phragmitis]
MNTADICGLLKELDAARDELKKLKEEASLLSLSGHQNQISIQVGNSSRSLAIARIESRNGYASTLVRGREMILLGVKKAYAALISTQAQRVRDLEESIQQQCKFGRAA